ncbi:MAG: hypothetical protein K2W96_17395, partial [Gemmataceae bacterium]|nr:hypothetical protein [Gemmataceae bacterium]
WVRQMYVTLTLLSYSPRVTASMMFGVLNLFILLPFLILLWRVMCEVFSVLFSIYDQLTAWAKEKAKGG